VCIATTGPNSFQAFLPGSKITDIYGNKWVCGPDGKWFRDYSAATITSTPLDAKQTSAVTEVQVAPMSTNR
jgi:hypothetical protein